MLCFNFVVKSLYFISFIFCFRVLLPFSSSVTSLELRRVTHFSLRFVGKVLMKANNFLARNVGIFVVIIFAIIFYLLPLMVGLVDTQDHFSLDPYICFCEGFGLFFSFLTFLSIPDKNNCIGRFSNFVDGDKEGLMMVSLLGDELQFESD